MAPGLAPVSVAYRGDPAAPMLITTAESEAPDTVDDRSHRRSRDAVAGLLAGVLLLAACGDDAASPEPGPIEEAGDQADDPQADDPQADDEERLDEPGDTDDADDTTAEVGDEPDDNDHPDGDAAELDTDASTEESRDEGAIDGFLAVTDVRVGAHDGFDRVTFELEGEATAGWFVAYEDEPTSQGRGEPIDVDGDAYLGVALRNISLPPELPDEVDRFDEERHDGPNGAEQVVEVVADTIFEGIQLFYIGVEEPTSYRIDRLEDPQRVVIDVLHD